MPDRIARHVAAVGKLRQRASEQPDLEPEFAQALVQLADDLDAAGRRPEALDCLHEAEQLYRDRIREWHPEELLLAGCLGREARWQADADPAAAERRYAEEDEMYLAVANLAPAGQIADLVQMLYDAAEQNFAVKNYRSAEGAARACLVLASKLVDHDPAAERSLVNIRGLLAFSLRAQGKDREARSEMARTIDFARAAAAAHRLSEDDLVKASDMMKLFVNWRGAPAPEQEPGAI